MMIARAHTACLLRGRPDSTAGTAHATRVLTGIATAVITVLLMIGVSASSAEAIQNTATGTTNGVLLDTANATVTLMVQNGAVDPDKSSVTVSPAVVNADGVATSTITIILRDMNNQPVAGKTITIASDRGAMDTIIQPAAATDASGMTTGSISSTFIGVATITATDVTDGVVLTAQPQVAFNQGVVLILDKKANKDRAMVGDVVTYSIEIRNITLTDAQQVRVIDTIPPNFKYLKGSVRLDGASLSDPSGNRALTFVVGTVPALSDANGNGTADPGEQGYLRLSYQLVIGSGALPRDYVNTAVAADVCDQCLISNRVEESVAVVQDPLFDLGTIIGKVFEDKNRDGWQDKNEPGVAGAMVVLDNGTYALTDEHGRYHLPAVTPGHRLVKLNLASISSGAAATTDEAVVVSVTPGLLAKANFGAIAPGDTESIGRAKQLGIALKSEGREKPLQLIGSAETLTILMNGQTASLPTADVQMAVEGLNEVVEINGGKLDAPVRFTVALMERRPVATWYLAIFDDQGTAVRMLRGTGAPPDTLLWDGMTEDKKLVKGGSIYQYQFVVQYADGSRATGPRVLFGVNQTTAIAVRMSGSAFKTGSDVLNEEAKTTLAKAAEILRKFPQEKIVIEGHTDSTGTDQKNLELSKKRAEAALDHLVTVEKLPAAQFTVRWHGSARPMAANTHAEGRQLNRRVEIKGEVHEVDRARLLDEYRAEPVVTIGGSSLPLDPQGRFSTEVEPDARGQVDIEMANSRGGSVKAKMTIPRLEIIRPKGEIILPYGERTEQYRVSASPRGEQADAGALSVEYEFLGRTETGNDVKLDGKPLAIDADGTFRSTLRLKQGNNTYGLLVRNPSGYTRAANLAITVRDHDDQGRLVVAVKPVPNLVVKFPRPGAPLKDLLTISGLTDRGNTIQVNGRVATVQPDGQFAHTVTLEKGTNPVVVTVTDPEGHAGEVKREFTITDPPLFFLAFADGVVGRMSGKGYLDGAGMSKSREYYAQGRVAYYLKGTIAGKYLITSAFDTGTRDFNDMFKNLDRTENDRLLTNIDPDKLYPVYGDSSTIVYDAQSQGKFYLAVDSDEFHLLVGNYPLALTDTELATYQRTLYGGRIAYHSVSRTKYGRPDTEVVLFGAEVRQAHVQDELRAIGGSLYYLSHRDVIEGSEQVTLVVRDKNTGLTLSRTPQRQNIDYTVKYEEGRILFRLPVSSVTESGSLIDQSVLPGNPVFIKVDYETRIDAFGKTAGGGRVRRQVGDHVSIGGTYITDELESGQYDLTGADAEVRFGKNSRVIAEYAASSGTDALTFVSNDGGLTYTETTPGGIEEGRAWKVAADLDLGEPFGSPDRVRVGGYLKELEPGFRSNGNTREDGTRKSGMHTRLRLSREDSLRARYDREEIDTSGAPGITQTDTASVQYLHVDRWWDITGEYQSRRSTDLSGAVVLPASFGALRLRIRPMNTLSLHVERQETITGAENDQTTLGVKYRILPALSLEASGTKGTLGSAMLGGITLTLDGKRLYLTERMSQDHAGRSSATILGTEYLLGNSSKIYSEYQWEHGDGDHRDRTHAVIGAQKTWDRAKGLSFLLSGEQTSIASATEQLNRYALAAGLRLVSSRGFAFRTREEVRRETGSQKRIQYLTINKIDIKLHTDLTLTGKYRYSVTQDRDQGKIEARFDERSIGLAYRPATHDRFNALARYTWLTDLRPVTPDDDEPMQSHMNVASLEWSFQASPAVEWVEKGAMKVKDESAGNRPAVRTHTYLLIHRLNVALWRMIDIGAEYRTLRQREADDQRQGWLAEVMWKPVKHMRFGIGYNFTNFSDNEFSTNDYSAQGWFIRLQGRY